MLKNHIKFLCIKIINFQFFLQNPLKMSKKLPSQICVPIVSRININGDIQQSLFSSLIMAFKNHESILNLRNTYDFL